MNSRWKLVPVEPTETMVINGFESEPNECFTDDEVWEQYQEMSGCQQAAFRAKLCWAAMLGAAPVMTIVGQPAVLLDQLDDFVARCNGDDRGSSETVNELRAHIIRLQAERDALQLRLNAADQRIDEMAAAAEPFAKVADLYAGEEDNSHEPARDVGMHDDLRLTLGQFRALRELCIRPLMVGCKNGILCGDVTCECKGNGFVERDHQIPRTSGVRLNMLANQGE